MRPLFSLFCLFILLPAGFAAGQDIVSFTEPYRSVDVASTEMGTIREIAVEEGEKIRKGQLVAKLDDRVLRSALQLAEQAAKSKGQLNASAAELKVREEQFSKLVALHERGHASNSELDRAKTQLQQARSQLEAAEDNLRLKSLEKQRIEKQLELLQLRAPFAGWVNRIHKESGAYVSLYEPEIIELVQLNVLKVEFSVPHQVAAQLTVGDSVTLRIGRQAPETAEGEIRFISPVVDAQTGTSRVKVRIHNPNLRFRAGVSCLLVIE